MFIRRRLAQTSQLQVHQPPVQSLRAFRYLGSVLELASACARAAAYSDRKSLPANEGTESALHPTLQQRVDPFRPPFEETRREHASSRPTQQELIQKLDFIQVCCI